MTPTSSVITPPGGAVTGDRSARSFGADIEPFLPRGADTASMSRWHRAYPAVLPPAATPTAAPLDRGRQQVPRAFSRALFSASVMVRPYLCLVPTHIDAYVQW
ncbi:hypothetical protein GCM10011581_42030 [Saccharopolyspora subtropica]|uniref:Uncharacterized protein n=1 Tax=Saccharopolyspora thermophila TaxID=89367 RepID=A0A917NHA6_9PSEU|nr:hypothetical protein GCM10011581_42030 [Saccharopolyspora subtropica]